MMFIMLQKISISDKCCSELSDQINAGLVSRRDFFKKHLIKRLKKTDWPQTFEQ